MVCSRSDVTQRQDGVRKHLVLHVKVVLHDVIVHLWVIFGLLATSGKAGHNSAAKWIGNGWEQDFGHVVDGRVEQVGDNHLHLEGHIRKRPETAAKRGPAVAKDIPCKTGPRFEIPFRDIVSEGMRYVGKSGIGRGVY